MDRIYREPVDINGQDLGGWAGRRAAGGPTWELKEPERAERPPWPRWETREGMEQRRGLLLVVLVDGGGSCRSGSLKPLSRCTWINIC